MTRFVLVLLVACGSPAEPDSQASTGSATVVSDEDDDDAVPVEGEPVTSDAPIPMRYYIDGEQVDEAAFRALHDRLTIDAEAFEGETVENSDGSYGGASESFHARDGAEVYIYTNATFRGEDDTVSESRSLRRVD